MSMINLIGRTQEQQEKVEAELARKGSLWGRLEILHKFIFTSTELNAVNEAHKIIEAHKQKRQQII